ncbi:UTP--glucose-1-phosphate uridylyltransferase [Clostridium sp. FP1]|uniref:UTP--glucose-1-phosphate uridylyltransferase n=1 Tax=Clostridium sp. FP1 TaxID=2724076 RepID=UPI0013E93D46|nr:sugar phosphate nucleotidyltransferase [Clostridium sp. FP1]MBZ9636938.1 NTP transferase domain-containing protein [Clostridium sp. FP1]
MRVRKAIIPAAGLGTRFLPATKALPKEMLPIVDKPTMQYIIEEAVEAGIEEILVITGRNKKSIEDHFDKSVELELELEDKHKDDLLKQVRDISNMVNIHFIRQKEPKGLGDAINCARAFVGNEPFAVMLGDKLGFLEATVEFALKRADLKVPFMEYLQTLKYNENFRSLYEEVIRSGSF